MKSLQMMKTRNDDLPVFVKWVDFLSWLLPTTEKFPQRSRFTFANRIDNLALDLVEDLVEARYAHEKRGILTRANLRLEKLRILLRLCHELRYLPLLRLCHELRYLPHGKYEYAMRAINETGKMLGGWRKQQTEK
jgi:hypothetical protein